MTGFRKHRQRGAAPHVCHRIDLAELRRSLGRPPSAARPAAAPASAAVPEGPSAPAATNGHAPPRPRVNGHNGHATVVHGNGTGATRPAQAGSDGRDRGHERQIDILERRVRKLAGLLEMREEELRRLLAEPGEQGISSIYQRVQGIRDEGPRGELKRLLMSKIYEANLKLQERVSSLRQTAE